MKDLESVAATEMDRFEFFEIETSYQKTLSIDLNQKINLEQVDNFYIQT